MEIEAKFALPDVETFHQLQAVSHIAGFALSAHQVQQVHDTYLDTIERSIMKAGYTCRRREQEAEVLITLKELGDLGGAVHRREEFEITLPAYAPPAQWPQSRVRDFVLELIGKAPLIPLFDLQQIRVFRRMSQGELPVAELSLDQVHLTIEEEKRSYLEMEVELAPQGNDDDMATIVNYLQEKWGLIPERRSKFERALELLDESISEGSLLTSQEKLICKQIAQRDDVYGPRAQGLLALDRDLPQNEVAEHAGRSQRTVRRWLSAFHEERLHVFPDQVLEEVGVTLVSEPPQIEEPPELEPQPQPKSIEALLERYEMDRTQARSVANHALALFDHLSPFHGLPPERRSLLETAAMVHNVGLKSDPKRPHKVGRDILLTYPLANMSGQERMTIALTTYLHRKRLTPKKLNKKISKSDFADLQGEAQEEAMAMAALVRMAYGLDYSQTHTSELSEVKLQDDTVTIKVDGPYATIDAARAQKKSDLWHILFDTELQFKPTLEEMKEAEAQANLPEETVLELTDEVDETSLTAPEELPERPGISPDDTMIEAAHKTFAFHFQRMLYHEPGTRLGEDIEELHDMRVATRRMRAAFRVFEQYLDMKQLKSLLKGLRRTGKRLGAVRDLDVFWEKTQRHLDGLPPEQQTGLESLHEAWEAERKKKRKKMLDYLDSERYAQFNRDFAQFLQAPDTGELPSLTKKGEAIPRRLRHVAPMIIYERVADVLAYDEWVTRPDVPLNRLHRLRIAAKRLRYTLEFFEEALAPQTKDLIKEMKKLQDHLGDLQDAMVASELLRDFLTWGTWGHAKGEKAPLPKEPIVAPGVATYMADKQTELQRLLDTFPQTWAYFQSPEFKQAVAVAITSL